MGKKRKRTELRSIGRHYGKVDLERVGFFDDTPAGPFDEHRKPADFREGGVKGRQLLAGPPAGLFEKKFIRAYEGEPLDESRQAGGKSDSRGKMIGGRPMLPPTPGQKHSTPNDWYGCFGKHTYFSPATRERVKRSGNELPNCKIKPNPLGGPGYVDICINPYPKHIADPYETEVEKGAKAEKEGRFLSASAPADYFPPNPYVSNASGPTYVRPSTEGRGKMIGSGHIYVPFPKNPGGAHAGCFDKFPEYVGTPYRPIAEKHEEEKRWIGGGPTFRTKYTSSIIDHVTRISCNANNYPEYTPRIFQTRN